MADGIIDVQYPKVQQAIEELMEQTQGIITTLNNLEDELKPLVTTWEGADQESATAARRASRQILDRSGPGGRGSVRRFEDVRIRGRRGRR
ncbi:hypothetical protein [Streptomyces sp. NBC_01481]|uniref:hypothetical protein n=1 Tax=Streptomyces sp. NBC_01481 TaxID=2975869 RepID=UPI00224FBC2F|nr:hypothetical protein [Streptomyces sp. NBC_01481]MCX4586389.1 hypothetical protein [Streptomyces sp. NBC_01481]